MSRSRVVATGFDSVAEIFDEIHNGAAPGASFAATVNGEQVVDLWGGSTADTEPWRDDTLCGIASGTKGISAVVVMICVERGLIDLEAPIETVWPEFAVGGKGHVLIGDALAHVAGVPGLETKPTIEQLEDPILMASLLAQQQPFVPIGTPCYHALTFGWIASEVVRRSDGRSIGAFVREELAGPLGLDLRIGAPESALSRIARTTRSSDFAYSANLPGRVPTLDPRLEFVYGIIPTEFAGTPRFYSALGAGAGAVSTAHAMSRLYGMLANGGILDGVRILRPETIALARRQRSLGLDPLSDRLLRFGVGFELNPNPSCLGGPIDAFGHTGAGGSSHGAWPSLRTSFSYAMGEFRPENNDGRATRLVTALEACVTT